MGTNTFIQSSISQVSNYNATGVYIFDFHYQLEAHLVEISNAILSDCIDQSARAQSILTFSITLDTNHNF